ncbi:hypothetical protein WG78_15675 [Amantichitinum ursilacus]|uniref:Uncharacterized protein n=1 Tax=Amantichitinum ursilacus TaxID=857265 RepID=A0A0N0XH95_9NEIS|nr:hypothetical protein WG78_15675 [Amantichitinum ursilacus]
MRRQCLRAADLQCAAARDRAVALHAGAQRATAVHAARRQLQIAHRRQRAAAAIQAAQTHRDVLLRVDYARVSQALRADVQRLAGLQLAAAVVDGIAGLHIQRAIQRLNIARLVQQVAAVQCLRRARHQRALRVVQQAGEGAAERAARRHFAVAIVEAGRAQLHVAIGNQLARGAVIQRALHADQRSAALRRLQQTGGVVQLPGLQIQVAVVAQRAAVVIQHSANADLHGVVATLHDLAVGVVQAVGVDGDLVRAGLAARNIDLATVQIQGMGRQDAAALAIQRLCAYIQRAVAAVFDAAVLVGQRGGLHGQIGAVAADAALRVVDMACGGQRHVAAAGLQQLATDVGEVMRADIQQWRVDGGGVGAQQTAAAGLQLVGGGQRGPGGDQIAVLRLQIQRLRAGLAVAQVQRATAQGDGCAGQILPLRGQRAAGGYREDAITGQRAIAV